MSVGREAVVRGPLQLFEDRAAKDAVSDDLAQERGILGVRLLDIGGQFSRELNHELYGAGLPHASCFLIVEARQILRDSCGVDSAHSIWNEGSGSQVQQQQAPQL